MTDNPRPTFQAVPQPYPLYCAALEVFRVNRGDPLEYTVQTGLVVGWMYPLDPEGEVLPAEPVLATAAGCNYGGQKPQPHDSGGGRVSYYFAATPGEVSELATAVAVRRIDGAERERRAQAEREAAAADRNPFADSADH